VPKQTIVHSAILQVILNTCSTNSKVTFLLPVTCLWPVWAAHAFTWSRADPDSPRAYSLQNQIFDVVADAVTGGIKLLETASGSTYPRR
jgi:hypothetical protein